jgi:uncharacterized protein YndB with AHSA1/START domain
MRLLLAFLLAAAPAMAVGEVVSSAPGGFESRNVKVVSATPAETFAMLGRPGEWWSGEHSYSGEPKNLSMKLEPGGCFCEKLPDGGGVEHGRLLSVVPRKRLVLSAPLGPLQAEGVAATLSWSLEAVEGGTEVTQTLVVGGFIRGGAEKLAAPVDAVLAEQLTRLQALLAD